MEKIILGYQVRSYNGKITKDYKNYKSARKFCAKLINQDIDCSLHALTVMQDEKGIHDLNTLIYEGLLYC